jgi:arginine:ornithine antiporter/lysine permease
MQATMAMVYCSNNACNVVISFTGVMIMPAFIGATVYLGKLTAQGQYPAIAKIGKTAALVNSILGTVYGVWLVYAAGVEYMIAGAVFFYLGNVVFMWARREHASDQAMFTKIEMAVALTLVVLGAVAMWMLFLGHQHCRTASEL